MKSSLSVSLLGAAVVAVGALAYRLGQSRCRPVRATAGPAADDAPDLQPTLPDASEALNGLVDRIRSQGF